MKRIVLSSLTILVFTIYCQSQSSPVQKGYYGIGDNHAKLSSPAVLPAGTLTSPVITKGYYSMKGKNKQLASRPLKASREKGVPAITKGYYSIGKNACKLDY
jgi:hypothetical protein